MSNADKQKLLDKILKLDQAPQKPFRKAIQSRLLIEQSRKKDKK